MAQKGRPWPIQRQRDWNYGFTFDKLYPIPLAFRVRLGSFPQGTLNANWNASNYSEWAEYDIPNARIYYRFLPKPDNDPGTGFEVRIGPLATTQFNVNIAQVRTWVDSTYSAWTTLENVGVIVFDSPLRFVMPVTGPAAIASTARGSFIFPSSSSIEGLQWDEMEVWPPNPWQGRDL